MKRKLRKSKPAPTSNTTANESCVTTSVARSRVSRRSANEQQVREVDTPDEQNERDSDRQRDKRRLRGAGDLFVKWNEPSAHFGVGLRKVSSDARRDASQVGLGRGERHSRLQPSD